MKLNCRPGDLAYAVSAKETPEMIGRLVLVERLAGKEEYEPSGPTASPAWIVASVGRSALPIRFRTAGPLVFRPQRPFSDAYLRPIRPQPDDAEDESFKWAPAPEKVYA